MEMDQEKFRALARKYKVVPVYQIITADLLTPVLAYIKLRNPDNYCFLLESVEGIGRLARYSFVGRDPLKIIRSRGTEITVTGSGKISTVRENLFKYLKKEITRFSYPHNEDLPDFTLVQQ